jgi:hypothetical protein
VLTDEIKQALAKDRVIDMTTTGRTSGQPRRKETWFHNIDGQVYLTGTPGKRDWYANMVAHPAFTFHLKESAMADLAARAHPSPRRPSASASWRGSSATSAGRPRTCRPGSRIARWWR